MLSGLIGGIRLLTDGTNNETLKFCNLRNAIHKKCQRYVENVLILLVKKGDVQPAVRL